MVVRLGRVEEVEEIVRLERGVPTAPHWGEGVYREMVVGGEVRRGLFVACEEVEQHTPGAEAPFSSGNVRPEEISGSSLGLPASGYLEERASHFEAAGRMRTETRTCDGDVRPKESADKVGDPYGDVPRRLKPDSSPTPYGTPEGVSLSKTRDGDAMGGAHGRVGGEIVGFAVGRVLGEVGEVESIAVRETEQRRGVGRALLEAVMGWCAAEGAREIELEVRAGGVAARRLYESAGFTVVGMRRGYYDEPVEDAVLMRWEGRNGEET